MELFGEKIGVKFEAAGEKFDLLQERVVVTEILMAYSMQLIRFLAEIDLDKKPEALAVVRDMYHKLVLELIEMVDEGDNKPESFVRSSNEQLSQIDVVVHLRNYYRDILMQSFDKLGGSKGLYVLKVIEDLKASLAKIKIMIPKGSSKKVEVNKEVVRRLRRSVQMRPVHKDKLCWAVNKKYPNIIKDAFGGDILVGHILLLSLPEWREVPGVANGTITAFEGMLASAGLGFDQVNAPELEEFIRSCNP